MGRRVAAGLRLLAAPHSLLGTLTCPLAAVGALVLAALLRALAVMLAVMLALLVAGGSSQIAAFTPRAPARYLLVGCRLHGPAIAYRSGPGRRWVALSFDDGPAQLTPRFVSMLQANGAVATFFMIGEQLSGADRGLLGAELRDGDALGDHTWSHPDLVRSGGTRSQLQRTLAAVRMLSGYTPCVFRPPYGSYDTQVITGARALGLATVAWNVDPSDWARPGVAAIVQRVLAQVRPGSIVLSHDGGGPREQTLRAYPRIIAALRARGYRFVTVPQLLGFRPVYVRCTARCAGRAISAPLPAGSIVQGD